MDTQNTPSWRARYRQLRHAIYEIIDGAHGGNGPGRIFDAFLVGLILLNIAAFVAETVPSLEARYRAWFYDFELVSVGIFTAEYLLRIWTAVEMPFLSRLPAWKARLALARSPALIIDLLAFLPFYLSAFLSLDLRALRALRLLRFLKLSRYSPAMHSLIRVVVTERHALMGAGLLLLGAVLFAATGMYYLEGHVQPDRFGSVPDAAWWAISTLTTVGYGDVLPATAAGRFFASLIMVLGLCILALPVAIIAAGFAQEVSRRNFVVTWSLMSRIPMLSELDAREVGAIMPLLHAHNLPPNVEVLAANTRGDALYFIASGKVTMKTPEGEETFQQGDVFGVVGMLANDVERGTFTTASKCRLLKLHREDFHRLETAKPEIAANLRSVAARRRARHAAHHI